MIESPMSARIRAASFQNLAPRKIKPEKMAPPIMIPTPAMNESPIAANPLITADKALSPARRYPRIAMIPMIPR